MQRLWRVLSILLVVWAILTGPPAVISLITRFTDWPSLLEGPMGEWDRNVEDLSLALPFVDVLPAWLLNLIYLALLAAFSAWYYWASIATEARRQLSAATAGTLGPVTPMPTGATLAHGAAITTGGAGFIVGNTLVQVASYAGAAALSGMAIMTGGIALAIGALMHIGYRKERAERHAQLESERLERQRHELALVNIAVFKQAEQRKVRFALLVIAAIVAINFGAMGLYELLGNYA